MLFLKLLDCKEDLKYLGPLNYPLVLPITNIYINTASFSRKCFKMAIKQ